VKREIDKREKQGEGKSSPLGEWVRVRGKRK